MAIVDGKEVPLSQVAQMKGDVIEKVVEKVVEREVGEGRWQDEEAAGHQGTMMKQGQG